MNDRWADFGYFAYQHLSLVVQCVALGTVLAIALAVVITRFRWLEPVANLVTSVGMTLPSLALLGVAMLFFSIGVGPAVFVVTFYATLPILRNAVVGLKGVDPVLIESATGMGLGRFHRFVRVELPLAWPVIHAGIRTSAQMSMGIAAIAAYVNGPGLGAWIFQALSQVGGANATHRALAATLGIVLLALVLDLLLALLGRFTISKGIRS